MTTLQLIEKKVPELTQTELLILLEKVVHSLKTYSVVQENVPNLKTNTEKGITTRLPFKIYDYEVRTKSNFSREEIYAD